MFGSLFKTLPLLLVLDIIVFSILAYISYAPCKIASASFTMLALWSSILFLFKDVRQYILDKACANEKDDEDDDEKQK